MRRTAALVALVMVLASCGTATSGTVTLLTHDFFVISDQLTAQFTADTGYELEIVRGGDAGLVVNQAILAAGNPVADVLFGVDTTLLSRTLSADLFESNDDTSEVTPIDFGDVCLNYDTTVVDSPPATLADLAAPTYAGMLVVPDPTISTPGLAFLLATIEEFGEEGDYTWRDFWADLRTNDLRVVADWGTAYYGAFSANGGDRPIVVSYASSPPAEVLFADPPIDAATTAVIEAGCFRQIEYAGILRGSSNPEGAQAFIDFLLTDEFQASVPSAMFVFPIRADIELPAVFVDNTRIPDDPVTMSPEIIENNRERWLAEWVETVLR
jgi:thiamine transport system substrate-binding protein